MAGDHFEYFQVEMTKIQVAKMIHNDKLNELLLHKCWVDGYNHDNPFISTSFATCKAFTKLVHSDRKCPLLGIIWDKNLRCHYL